MSSAAIQKAMENAEASINMEGLYVSDLCKNLYNFARLYTYYTLLLEHIRPYFTAVAKKALGEF